MKRELCFDMTFYRVFSLIRDAGVELKDRNASCADADSYAANVVLAHYVNMKITLRAKKR
jgi:hypothetical protein